MQPLAFAATLRVMSKWLLISLALLFASGSTRGDDAAAAQRDLIDAQIAHFPAETGSEAHVYFLGFAGYGEERVFAEEIKLAAKIVGEKYWLRVAFRVAAQ